MGVVDFNAPEEIHVDAPQLLLPINIANAGEYVLVVKLLDSGKYDGIRRFILDGTGAPMLDFANASMSIDKEIIRLGETAQITASCNGSSKCMLVEIVGIKDIEFGMNLL